MRTPRRGDLNPGAREGVQFASLAFCTQEVQDQRTGSHPEGQDGTVISREVQDEKDRTSTQGTTQKNKDEAATRRGSRVGERSISTLSVTWDVCSRDFDRQPQPAFLTAGIGQILRGGLVLPTFCRQRTRARQEGLCSSSLHRSSDIFASSVVRHLRFIGRPTSSLHRSSDIFASSVVRHLRFIGRPTSSLHRSSDIFASSVVRHLRFISRPARKGVITRYISTLNRLIAEKNPSETSIYLGKVKHAFDDFDVLFMDFVLACGEDDQTYNNAWFDERLASDMSDPLGSYYPGPKASGDSSRSFLSGDDQAQKSSKSNRVADHLAQSCSSDNRCLICKGMHSVFLHTDTSHDISHGYAFMSVVKVQCEHSMCDKRVIELWDKHGAKGLFESYDTEVKKMITEGYIEVVDPKAQLLQDNVEIGMRRFQQKFPRSGSSGLISFSFCERCKPVGIRRMHVYPLCQFFWSRDYIYCFGCRKSIRCFFEAADCFPFGAASGVDCSKASCKREASFESLRHHITHYWCDSRIVLAYIASDTRRFKAFVANRVGIIRAHSNPQDWNHSLAGNIDDDPEVYKVALCTMESVSLHLVDR
ncbi:hypothetical protein CAPTEDRAFT_204043 [Capitella teleta]|uniref:Uncharacterized protein n=1 Tax=Capitella teleta TaxID=283909 RepID=R7TKR9_CAPTE|nr:hypothetical protein CAPTEDRAFT_204043 [Capitella teleta]|eukprot:ELT94398.1 hypothetical protein CAPTEDRAFT_204043 [Capitella teleta]